MVLIKVKGPKNNESREARHVRLTQRIESSPGFKAIQNHYAQENAKKRAAQKEAWDSNAEVQRRKQMTSDEKARGAIERVAKNFHDFNQQHGNDITFEEAQEKAVSIAERSDKEKND